MKNILLIANRNKEYMTELSVAVAISNFITAIFLIREMRRYYNLEKKYWELMDKYIFLHQFQKKEPKDD